MADWFAKAGLEAESPRRIEGGGRDKLTVKLWIGRDPRLLIAEPASQNSRELA